MKLLTKANKVAIPPLYSQENNSDPQAVVKFFTPWGRWTWFVTEGGLICPEHGLCDCRECPQPWTEFLFFGFVKSGLDPNFDELGYFRLSELQSVRGPAPFSSLGVERDLYFKPKPLSAVKKAA